jgi:hypothetical protein
LHSNRPSPPWASGAGGPRVAADLPLYPHGGEIARRLGKRLPAGATVDPEGCARIGVPAFTIAGRTHFATPHPALNVAAHEAAHVLQQIGVTRDAGLGAEPHAAAVEQLVTGGGDARALIGPHGSPTGPGPHPYKLIPKAAQSAENWPAGRDLRVSDEGLMAVEAAAKGSKSFWATNAAVNESNYTFDSVRSPLQLTLVPADILTGPAPVGGAIRTLTKIAPVNRIDGTMGDAMVFPSDCGAAARTIMGADTLAAGYRNVSGPGRAGASRETSVSVSKDPVAMAGEVLAGASGAADSGAARESYDALTAEEREAFDKAAGINRYARAATGGGYVIATGPIKRGPDWNFHWAGVLMTSGNDQVTLENYSGQAKTKWGFAMYGTALGQSFHEEHFGTKKHGTRPITMGVHRTDPP